MRPLLVAPWWHLAAVPRTYDLTRSPIQVIEDGLELLGWHLTALVDNDDLSQPIESMAECRRVPFIDGLAEWNAQVVVDSLHLFRSETHPFVLAMLLANVVLRD